MHHLEELKQAWVALGVLGASIILELFSLVGALKEIKRRQAFLVLAEKYTQCRTGCGPGRR